ncbi:MAG TPA: carboxylesterase family protein [Gammaproteobacteria bacterium]|nr:carboxylesterase family protein [Gammaproteobacteria bacterium]
MKRGSRYFWLLMPLLIVGIACQAFASPVKTESGLVEGVIQDGLTVYKGIPFASPPVGDLRWRAPQPVTPWHGIRHAGSFAPECMQTGSYPPDAPPEPTSEDCLYLNIWRPAAADDARLPVMVWIYGGGLENGSASMPLYAGDKLARKGVIVVTLNYRLGVFGFLALPWLSKESPHRSSGDYGLLDQIAALNWVHRNIAAFGGDPGRVTVFGQSSGSISISALTASPLTKGLFQRAIGESGGLFEPLELAPDLHLAGAEQAGLGFSARAGATSLQALRKVPAAELMKTWFSTNLIVDGYALTEEPYDAYRDGRENDVSILIGSNADEGRLFTAGRRITPGNFTQELDDDFPGLLVWLIAPKSGDTDEAALTAAARFETDMRFRWDMITWARLAAGHGGHNVFLYQFDRTPPYPPGSRYAGLGATHGMEMPYVFDHLDLLAAPWTAEDHLLAEDMSDYWTNFAKSGDPNGQGLPAWPEYKRANTQAMYLGNTIRSGPVEDQGELKRISFVYTTARYAVKHVYLILTGAILLLILLILGLAVAVRRWRRRDRLQVQAGV